jgi:hypothetical protein
MLLIGGVVLLAGVLAQAQEPVFTGPGMMYFQKGPGYNYVYSTNIGDKELVKGAPYSATAVTESTQVLSDGNRIVNKSTTFQARDGEGRMRREMTNISSLPGGLPKLVTISDPVAKTETMLNERNQTARVMKGGEHGKTVFIERMGTKGTEDKGSTENAPGDVHRAMAFYNTAVSVDSSVSTEKIKAKTDAEQFMVQAHAMQGDVKHEDLGTQVIEGVSCTGTRETRTIAAGTIGNERPIEITSETWRSADLHLIVLSKHNDPRFGETVYKLTDIKRDEPDAALFQVPSGYKILENESPLLKP